MPNPIGFYKSIFGKQFGLLGIGATAATPNATVEAAADGVTVVGKQQSIASDNLTARAGGGQANALLLTSTFNTVTTVASANDSVKLGPSYPGAFVVVHNDGLNLMQVFASAPDTIDDVATAVGVAQNVNTSVLYFCTVQGEWHSLGGAAVGNFTNVFLTGLLYESPGAGIVASVVRTQAGATVLSKEVNRVDTSTAVALGTLLGDGVALMSAQAGLDIAVINNTANVITMWPLNGSADQINGLGAGVGVPLPPGDVAQFECAANGDWRFEPGFGAAGQMPTMLSMEGITAVSPVAQGTAFQIAAVINHVTTVNAAGAAVALMAAKYGLECAIENATGNPLTVYPFNGSGDTINGLAANAPTTIPGFTTLVFRSASNGTWQSDPFLNGAGLAPNTILQQTGSALTGGARSGGNVSVLVNAAGQGNGADTTDDVIATFALPANAFDVAGRQANITALGKTAANANNKRIKLWWGTTTQTLGLAVVGGTLIADSGVITANNGGWNLSATVTKYGAAGSNTQIGQGAIVAGTVHTGTLPPVLTAAPENAVINITVTGASPTTGAANDVLSQMFDVAFAN